MLHKVEALDSYVKLNVYDKGIGKVLPKGYQFEVDDARLEILLGKNQFNLPFVKELKEEKKTKKKSKKKE